MAHSALYLLIVKIFFFYFWTSAWMQKAAKLHGFTEINFDFQNNFSG